MEAPSNEEQIDSSAAAGNKEDAAEPDSPAGDIDLLPSATPA